MKTDLLEAMDDNRAVAVVLLDLSAAFDTVDHAILLNRLSSTFGIRDMALSWIRSYLQNRSFRVCVGDTKSDSQALCFGVPQGSVVGPLFFTMFISEINAIVRKHSIKYHMYADDIQLYLPFNPKIDGEAEMIIAKLNAYMKSVTG